MHRHICMYVYNVYMYISHISLYSWGEPLLHPYIDKIIDYVHQHNVAVALSSNLSIKFGYDWKISARCLCLLILYEKISFERIEWWFFKEDNFPPPLEPVIAVIEILLISEWNGSIANWLASAKQPGFAILVDFLISSKEDSIKP